MNDKIDVLAAIDSEIATMLERGSAKGSPRHKAMTEARAAIAELIQEAKTAEQVIRNLVTAGAHPNWGHYADDLRRALANVGGA